MRPCVEGEQRVQYVAQNRTSAVHLLEAEVKRRLQLLPQAPQQAGEGEGSQHTPHLIQKRTQRYLPVFSTFFCTGPWREREEREQGEERKGSEMC